MTQADTGMSAPVPHSHPNATNGVIHDTTSTTNVLAADAVTVTTPAMPHARALALAAQLGPAHGRPWRGTDLRRTRFLLRALSIMRIELGAAGGAWTASTLAARRAAAMSMWQQRAKALFVQPDVEHDIEARLEAAFDCADAGNGREAASELKRAYLLLCCVLTHARSVARGEA